MISQLSKTQKYKGELYLENEPYDECIFQFTFNPFDTNEMSITILDAPVKYVNDFRDKSVKIIITDHDFAYTFYLNTNLMNYDFSGDFNEYFFSVNIYVEDSKYPRDIQFGKILFIYKFPKTDLALGFSGLHYNSDYGFHHGEYDYENKRPIYNKKKLILTNEFADYTISSGYYFHDSLELKKYKVINAINHSYLRVDIVKEHKEIDAIISKFTNFLFQMISVIEQDRINWNSCERVSINTKNEVYHSLKTFRWASPVSDHYKTSKIISNKKEETIKIFFEQYNKQDQDIQRRIDKIFLNFIISNVSPTIETAIIHWHACLDSMIKFFEIDTKNIYAFSKKLVHVLDTYKINISDIVDKKSIDNIRSDKKGKKKFIFTEIRNAYVHDGFNAIEDYKLAMDQIKIMRTIAERLICGYLDIDYKNTCLGEFI